MTTKLSDDVLISKFNNLSNKNDIADLLQIRSKDLIFFLYRIPEEKKYVKFELKTKKNKIRTIMAPCKPIRYYQEKLKYVFDLVYEHHEASHGFIKEKSIITNAQKHIKRKFVLNLDIKDFFPSINFGRVRGMFKSKPFSFNNDVATVLAQICTFEDQLPQGAPTSPFISNVICRRLDNDLCRLAKKYKCRYTRYADDITFSTNLRRFPKELAQMIFQKDCYCLELGEEIENIFEENGFIINDKKVRLSDRTKRQEVTGLTVNEKLNVKRHFIKEIRAMLHKWETIGEEKAEIQMYQKDYYLKQINPIKNYPKFRDVVEGKINYLRMVRGKNDLLFRIFFNKYQDLVGTPDKKLLLLNGHEGISQNLEEIYNNLWVLECEEEIKQGSAFLLEEGILVTCAHVLGSNTKAFQYNSSSKVYDTKIISKNDDIDLAILQIDLDKSIFQGLKVAKNNVKLNDELIISGFPNYRLGDTPNTRHCKVAAFRNVSMINRFIIDKAIVSGDSGCPVLNKNNKVVGIAVTGEDNMGETKSADNYGVIPITALEHLDSIDGFINLKTLK